MTLSRIVMRLARNPGTEFAGGDDHRGYALTAPLTPDGLLDLDAYGKAKAECVVRRFAPDEDAADGRLARRGARWFFDYDEGDAADDEPVHRLGEHRFEQRYLPQHFPELDREDRVTRHAGVMNDRDRTGAPLEAFGQVASGEVDRAMIGIE